MRTVDFAFFSQIAYFDWHKINECGEFYFEDQIHELKIDIRFKMEKIKEIEEEIEKIKKNENLKEEYIEKIKKNENLKEEYIEKVKKNKNLIEQYNKEIKNRLENSKMYSDESEVLKLIEEKSDDLGVEKKEKKVDGIKLYDFEDKRLYAVYSEDSITQKPKFSFEGWKFCKGYSDKSGCQAAIFRKGKNYLIAFRGTDGPMDLIQDASLKILKAEGLLLSQVEYVWEKIYIKIIYKKNEDDNIYITGHSLGGWLAQWLYISSGKKHETVTFNAFGIDDITKYGDLYFATSSQIREIYYKGKKEKATKECINYINQFDTVGCDRIHYGKEMTVFDKKIIEGKEKGKYKKNKISIQPFKFHGVNDFIQFMDNDGNIVENAQIINETFKENYVKAVYGFLKKKKIFLKDVTLASSKVKLKIGDKSYKFEVCSNEDFEKILTYREEMFEYDIKVEKRAKKFYSDAGKARVKGQISVSQLKEIGKNAVKASYSRNYETIYKEKQYQIKEFIIPKSEVISKKIGCDYIKCYKVGKFNNINSIDITQFGCKENYIKGGIPYLVFIRKEDKNKRQNINTTYVLNGQKLSCEKGFKNPTIKVTSQNTKVINGRLIATTGDTSINGNFGHCLCLGKECILSKCIWKNASSIKEINVYDFLTNESYAICDICDQNIEIISEETNLKTK